MTNRFNYNFINKTIVGSKRSIERANKGMMPEYQELTKMLSEHPDFTVVEKVINVNSSKKTYSKLTIKRMEEYIKTQKDDEKRIKEFEAIKKVAKARGALYPLCKKWFFMTYPEFKENEITEDQTEALMESAEALVDSMMKSDDIDYSETEETAA